MKTKDENRMANASVATRIVVFQQQDSGVAKISGIKEYGHGIEIADVFGIDAMLPEIIDDPETYIKRDFEADLVLDFLKHPDLSAYLADICQERNIPLVASGRKNAKAITPFTCCGLGRLSSLGAYAAQFGMPELEVKTEGENVAAIHVVRGAPCGATWQVVPRVIGLPVSKAISAMAREVQYLCVADPSNFDPISGKSPLHYAGDVHAVALKKALAGEEKK